jgi:two-component system invasion response regulator UvrY
LVFTVFEFESHIIEMIKHGANGYLLKSCDPIEIINAIYAIYHNKYYYSETANDSTFNIAKNKNFKGIHFSDREVELLKYVCSEMSYADIAASMNTTYKTIDGIRERLCVKLGVSTRTGLALAAIQLGYYNIEPINNSQTTLH